jgi:ubiquinone/menaquinone biosynthesis C-methylase UbiE
MAGERRAEVGALPEESRAWKEAYRDPRLVARRMRKHRGKLARLGVLSWPRESRVLDLCCGTGEVLRILHAEGFTRLAGLDVTVDEELIKEPWLEARAGDSRALPYADATFDAVTCLHALHHLGGVSGIQAALKEALRVLKPGGRLALIDHHDSAQLRLAFWACRQAWLTWPTSGLRSFRRQLDEEWPYLTEYLDHWAEVRAAIEALGCTPVERDEQALFFFYWVGRKAERR